MSWPPSKGTKLSLAVSEVVLTPLCQQPHTVWEEHHASAQEPAAGHHQHAQAVPAPRRHLCTTDFPHVFLWPLARKGEWHLPDMKTGELTKQMRFCLGNLYLTVTLQVTSHLYPLTFTGQSDAIVSETARNPWKDEKSEGFTGAVWSLSDVSGRVTWWLLPWVFLGHCLWGTLQH